MKCNCVVVSIIWYTNEVFQVNFMKHFIISYEKIAKFGEDHRKKKTVPNILSVFCIIKMTPSVFTFENLVKCQKTTYMTTEIVKILGFNRYHVSVALLPMSVRTVRLIFPMNLHLRWIHNPIGHNEMGGIEWGWGRPHRRELPLKHTTTPNKSAPKVSRAMLHHLKTDRLWMSQVV